MSKHDVDSCAEVQTEMRWDMQEAVAQPANHLRHSAVFRAEYIDRVFRMLKRRKRLRVFKNLNAYGNTVLRKQLERPLIVTKIDVHPFMRSSRGRREYLAGLTRPPVQISDLTEKQAHARIAAPTL